MNAYDRLRLRLVAARYELALDARGVSPRRRRELRRELHANLTDAAHDVGAGRAIRALGGVGRMAAAVTEHDTGPRWRIGLLAASLALLLAMLVEAVAFFNYTAGATDAGPGRASGTLIPFPGAEVMVASGPDGFAFSWGMGWLPLALAVVSFALFARPWRLWRAEVSEAG